MRLLWSVLKLFTVLGVKFRVPVTFSDLTSCFFMKVEHKVQLITSTQEISVEQFHKSFRIPLRARLDVSSLCGKHV